MEEVFEHLIDVYNRREANHFMIPFIRNEILPRIRSRHDLPAFLQVEIDKINHYFNVTTLSPSNIAEYGFMFSKKLYLRDYLGISKVEP